MVPFRLVPSRLFALVLAAGLATSLPALAAPPADDGEGIHKIKHVIVIMQENRSFDEYFGTYPGADGLPVDDKGQFTTCITDLVNSTCAKPYHDSDDLNHGGNHTQQAALTDINNGGMDGFLVQAQFDRGRKCKTPQDPVCGTGGEAPDVMGYHDRRELPNYWAYADNFVLQDRMFEPNISWSLPAHLFMVSEWSANCKVPHDAMACQNDVETPRGPALSPELQTFDPILPWTDLTYLLHKNKVSWGYYVFAGEEPDCEDDTAVCVPVPQDAKTPGIWNPLPYFDTVAEDGELDNIKDIGEFFKAAKAGTLPSVSWVIPSQDYSEHPPGLVSAGQAYVTAVINAVMSGPNWDSTAIFLSWDDWGGFYDHVRPPHIDENGYGLRVPGLMISPYAKKGFIDHQTLSFDAYVKFIEDDFLGSARIDPKTDGRPDPRPDVREDEEKLGDLRKEFDFNQAPRPPMLLATNFTYPPPLDAKAEAALDHADKKIAAIKTRQARQAEQAQKNKKNRKRN